MGRVGDAPQSHCPIVAAAREKLPVRAERPRLYRFFVWQRLARGLGGLGRRAFQSRRLPSALPERKGVSTPAERHPIHPVVVANGR